MTTAFSSAPNLDTDIGSDGMTTQNNEIWGTNVHSHWHEAYENISEDGGNGALSINTSIDVQTTTQVPQDYTVWTITLQ